VRTQKLDRVLFVEREGWGALAAVRGRSFLGCICWVSLGLGAAGGGGEQGSPQRQSQRLPALRGRMLQRRQTGHWQDAKDAGVVVSPPGFALASRLDQWPKAYVATPNGVLGMQLPV
jgi:hypothetical protein